jgi:hypothetical protein
MPVWFQNSYKDTAYISLVWFQPACSTEPWRKIGWYAAAPGAKVEVVSGDLRNLRNLNFAWFAVAGNSKGPTWSGKNWYRIRGDAKFDQCYTDDTGCNDLRPFIVGALNRDWLGVTILLLGPGAADQPNQGCAWGIPLFPPEPKPRKPGPHK